MKRSHSTEGKRSQQHHMSTNTSRDKRMKKKKKKHKSSEDELRHHLHRRKDDATSAEYRKELSNDGLSLTKDQVTELSCLVGQVSHEKFVDQLFSVLSSHEIRSITPQILRGFSMSQLKKRCLKHFKLISNEKLKFILEGNKPEDFHKTQAESAKKGSIQGQEKQKQVEQQQQQKAKVDLNLKTNEKKDDRQHQHQHQHQRQYHQVEYTERQRVDDEEFSRLKVENSKREKFEKIMKDAEIQAHESSLDFLSSSSSSSSSVSDSEEASSSEENEEDDNGDGNAKGKAKPKKKRKKTGGWMNIFAKTSMEILELELRARAIRALMKAESSDATQSQSQAEIQVTHLKQQEEKEQELQHPQRYEDDDDYEQDFCVKQNEKLKNIQTEIKKRKINLKFNLRKQLNDEHKNTQGKEQTEQTEPTSSSSFKTDVLTSNTDLVNDELEPGEIVDGDSDDQDEPMESSDDKQVLRRLISKKELNKSVEPEIVFQEEMSPFESDESDDY